MYLCRAVRETENVHLHLLINCSYNSPFYCFTFRNGILQKLNGVISVVFLSGRWCRTNC